MTYESPVHRRNLFEIDNARNLSRHELVETFIPTQSFWRLLTAKHNVVLGARGQGKTALAKMISHDHLALMAKTQGHPQARAIIDRQEFVGIYLPTRLEWVGGLKNKSWLNERQREELFQWRLNIASCIAFIPIAASCIAAYVQGRANQARAEKELTNQLSKDWLADESASFDDLIQLRRHLEDTDYRKQIQLLRERAMGELPPGEIPVGLAFDLELFAPLRQGIRKISRILALNSNCTWLLCLDEAEFLDEMDHRIINSHMRAYPDNMFIKLTTMPYCHYTLATNIGAALVPGQDFGYVNMDSDRVLNARAGGDPDTIGTFFGRTLFRKLLEASDTHPEDNIDREPLGITDVLGESELLDPRREKWGADSENMRLLEKYASIETVDRARKLAGTRSFAAAISRKINGPLLLRKQVEEWGGNTALTAYSGARMAIRCGDDNPRHMIKIFNVLRLLQSNRQRGRMEQIPPSDQTRAMRSLSTNTLNQYRSLPIVGPALHAFLCMLGEYMHSTLHKKPLTTDQITSVVIDKGISDHHWKLVCVAVGHGLLHPNVNSGNPDEMPWREGTFHLAYAFAPHFLLLPRRGKAANLSTILFEAKSSRQQGKVLPALDSNQLQLFDEGAAQ